METVEPSTTETTETRTEPSGHDWLNLREAYAALAIAAMWIAVLFASVYGPDIVTESGSNSVRVPSGVAVAFFAFLATVPVAHAGFRKGSS